MHMQQKAGFAEVNGTRLYYELAGTGRPVVLLHGMSLDTRMWDDQFALLADQYQVLRYDARGFGRSALPTTAPYARVDDLKALLDYLGITHAALVGLSMGGSMAIDFALTYPETTAALIPVDSRLTGWEADPELTAMLTAVRMQARDAGIAAGRACWMQSQFFAPALENPAVAPRLAEIVADYSGWHWVNDNPLIPLVPPAVERLGTIQAPTLVVVGERDLQDCHAVADTLQRQIPNARQVVIPQVGHLANMEAPAQFNRLLLDFLDGLCY